MARNRPALVWIVPAALLFGAVLPWPFYGYYVFLRLVVTVCAGLITFWIYKDTARLNAWAIAMIFVALLFNPIVPVYLNRLAWAPIDIAAAALFGFHLMFVVRERAK